jgi:hypothetical protein
MFWGWDESGGYQVTWCGYSHPYHSYAGRALSAPGLPASGLWGQGQAGGKCYPWACSGGWELGARVGCFDIVYVDSWSSPWGLSPHRSQWSPVQQYTLRWLLPHSGSHPSLSPLKSPTRASWGGTYPKTGAQVLGASSCSQVKRIAYCTLCQLGDYTMGTT